MASHHMKYIENLHQSKIPATWYENVLLTFATTIHSQLLKLRTVGNPPGKVGVPFGREGQVQLAHTGHRPSTRAGPEITERPL